MTHRSDTLMDELPDLQSDADVDALMARLRARATPPSSPSVSTATDAQVSPAATGDPIRDLVAAQDAFATAVMRALQMIAETLEDLQSAAVHDSVSDTNPVHDSVSDTKPVHDSVSDTRPPQRRRRKGTARASRRTAARGAR